jgi:hypothetical protein
VCEVFHFGEEKANIDSLCLATFFLTARFGVRGCKTLAISQQSQNVRTYLIKL